VSDEVKARPFIIGLTGSIGMGKTQTARLFATEGVPVFDADAAIHRLYRPGGGAVSIVEKAFPGAIEDGAIDRAALSRLVVEDEGALARLEALLHPLVAAERGAFLRAHAAAPIVLFDIPLLLESKVPVDAVVVASAPAHVQRARVMARPDMSEDKFTRLLARQMSDAQKRQQAHFVVMTDKGLDHAREQVKMILAEIRSRQRTENRDA
jgi:dephospho-CoA kinase